MKKLIQFLYIALAFMILSAIASIFIEIKLALSALFFVLIAAAYTIYKKKIGQELIIAALFGIIVTSYYVYSYTASNILFGRINIFPFISWTAGLILLREIYERLKFKNKFPIISLIYISGLFLVEFLGFYILNIRLENNYASLLGLGIIHAPAEMKLFYIFAGPVYILLTDYLKVK